MNGAKHAKLVALCSAAIVGLTTVTTVDAQTLTAHVNVAHHATTHVTKKSTKAKTTTKTKTTAKKKPVAKPVVKQKYKDGTYKGIGTTNIGSVEVQLTLKKDKITNVSIIGYSTHYPIQYIDPILPKELLARQNINQVDVVSGATLSSEDFYYAVQSCLQQATNVKK